MPGRPNKMLHYSSAIQMSTASLELMAIENIQEAMRCRDFKKHLNLIDKIYYLNQIQILKEIKKLPVLIDPKPRFKAQTIYKGMPERKEDDKNLLTCLLSHPNINNHEKKYLLYQLIYNKNYRQFIKTILTEPVIHKFLANKDTKHIIVMFYIDDYLKNQNKFIAFPYERLIWQAAFNQPSPSTVLMIYDELTLQKKHQLLYDWIKAIKYPERIVIAYNFIQKKCNLGNKTNQELYKLAKQQILHLELKHMREDKSTESIGINFFDKNTSNFLNTHRGYFSCLYSMFYQPKSMDIYELLENKNYNQAKAIWNEEQKNEYGFCAKNKLVL